MEWHDLEKMKVNELRDLAKEKTTIEGLTGLSKEKLVEAVAHAMGMHKPHKVVMGQEKADTRHRLKELRVQIAAALEKHDHELLKALRHNAHGLRHKLRRQARRATA